MLPKYGIVIFIHGCFWHGHEADGHIPKSNTEFWRTKIERNKQRDERDRTLLRDMGWSVMTVWECQLKPAVRRTTLLEIEYHINHAYLSRLSSPSTQSPSSPSPSTYPTTEPDIQSNLPIAADSPLEYGK